MPRPSAAARRCKAVLLARAVPLSNFALALTQALADGRIDPMEGQLLWALAFDAIVGGGPPGLQRAVRLIDNLGESEDDQEAPRAAFLTNLGNPDAPDIKLTEAIDNWSSLYWGEDEDDDSPGLQPE